MTSMAYSYRLEMLTVQDLICEICTALWVKLVLTQMDLPNSWDWELIDKKNDERQKFTHCLGSIHGKHVVMQAQVFPYL